MVCFMIRVYVWSVTEKRDIYFNLLSQSLVHFVTKYINIKIYNYIVAIVSVMDNEYFDNLIKIVCLSYKVMKINVQMF